jgi:hypothetical protein
MKTSASSIRARFDADGRSAQIPPIPITVGGDVFEHRALPPIPVHEFVLRLLRHGGYAAAVVIISMAAGTAGFHWLAREAPIDAVLNAAMLLGGMGPVGDLSHISDGGKVFAAGFALYSGLVFLIVAALLVTPVLHRVLHRFHCDVR